MIERQGQFPVEGITIERPGTFDPDMFTGWTNPVQDGQTYRCDHAFARFQIPVDAVNRHGGNATLVELPKIGIKGNSHFLMQELNNDEIAAHVARWLSDNNLSHIQNK